MLAGCRALVGGWVGAEAWSRGPRASHLQYVSSAIATIIIFRESVKSTHYNALTKAAR